LEIQYPTLLDFDRPVIKAYSEESVISEKFESMVKLSLINRRMKDFYDINYLMKQKKYEMNILQKAIGETFKNRNTIVVKDPKIFDENFYKDNDKITQWDNFVNKIRGRKIEFQIVMKNISKFLLPVYENILNDKLSNKIWDPNKIKWSSYKFN